MGFETYRTRRSNQATNRRARHSATDSKEWPLEAGLRNLSELQPDLVDALTRRRETRFWFGRGREQFSMNVADLSCWPEGEKLPPIRSLWYTVCVRIFSRAADHSLDRER